MKRRLGRPRPCPQSVGLGFRYINLRHLEKNFSLPSGDSAQAAGIATLLAIYFSYYSGHFYGTFFCCLPFFFIPIVMWSRVHFGVHYWGDTIVGSLIGASCAFISFNLLVGPSR
jgi:membrane-associated phospholipid phosphatase